MEKIIYKNGYAKKNLYFVEEVYHFCVALMPILYLINVPILDISLGTVLLFVFIPHSIIYIYEGIKKLKGGVSVIPFLLFYAYIISRADGGMARIMLCSAVFINIWGIMYGSIKIQKICKIIEGFALINLVLILMQILCHYIFRVNIQYIPQSIIHSEFQGSYVFSGTSGMNRPSSLFLEPSHYSQYCCFAIISALFPSTGKANLKKALLIAAGCIMTTSGMGIMLSFGIFAWYIFLNQGNKGVSKVISAFKWCVIIVIILIILLQIPFFQDALKRVFLELDGYNAIRGRLGQWGSAIRPMRGKTLLMGYGDKADYPYYLAGLADTIYKYGVICVALEFYCFLYLMFKKKENYVWCCSAVFLILFCFAHLTSVYVQIFYFGIIIAEIPKYAKKSAAGSGGFVDNERSYGYRDQKNFI